MPVWCVGVAVPAQEVRRAGLRRLPGGLRSAALVHGDVSRRLSGAPTLPRRLGHAGAPRQHRDSCSGPGLALPPAAPRTKATLGLPMAAEPENGPPSSVFHSAPFLLAGPTAVGKSEVAVLLAERIGGVIISVDSMQVYRAMDIGTGKPSPGECARVPHHLIDVVDLTVP